MDSVRSRMSDDSEKSMNTDLSASEGHALANLQVIPETEGEDLV